MTDKKVSREGMLEWLGNWIRVCKSCGEKPCEAACSPSDVKQCRQAEAAIRALIEHGPEVSRELVEKYANRISIATTWNGQNVRILKRAFREAGVTVKEKK